MRKEARSDEKFVKDAILEYLRLPRSSAIRGEDPPDYYICNRTSIIALEVRIAEPLGNRTTYERSLERLCNRLNKEFLSCVEPGISVLIKIAAPVRNTRKFYEQLKIVVSNNLTNNILQEKWKAFQVNEETVQLKIINHGIPEKKKIIGLIMGKGSALVPIQDQVNRNVANYLMEKSEKMKNITGTKWLGFLNMTILADENNFRSAIQNIDRKHDFSKIFLVEPDGLVNLIFSI